MGFKLESPIQILTSSLTLNRWIHGVNREWPSLHGGSLETTLTVPLKGVDICRRGGRVGGGLTEYFLFNWRSTEIGKFLLTLKKSFRISKLIEIFSFTILNSTKVTIYRNVGTLNSIYVYFILEIYLSKLQQKLLPITDV